MVDSKVTKTHILLKTVERLGIPYKKKILYLLVTILEELVLYKDGIINLKTGPI